MRGALVLLAAAAAVILAGGAALAVTWHLSYGHGLYCALGTASTVGCDASPRSPAGRDVSAVVMLTAIPLLAASFARLSAWLAARRVHGSMAGLRAEAAAARRIAADLYEHHTGQRHELAPDTERQVP